MKLNKEEIQYIDNYLIKNEVKYWDVRIELLDHIVSAVEDKIEKEGVSFNEALLDIHQAFGNTTNVYGIYNGKLMKEGLYAGNQGFKKFEKLKQIEIGKKYRKQHWQAFKQQFLSFNFLLEYLLVGLVLYFYFLCSPKVASFIGLILLMIPTIYSVFHSIKYKMARRSLNIVLSSGIALLPWTIYNMVLQIFILITKGQDHKPYYIFLILTLVCYPLMRSILKIYLKIYKDYKKQFNLMLD